MDIFVLFIFLLNYVGLVKEIQNQYGSDRFSDLENFFNIIYYVNCFENQKYGSEC